MVLLITRRLFFICCNIRDETDLLGITDKGNVSSVRLKITIILAICISIYRFSASATKKVDKVGVGILEVCLLSLQ